MASALQFGDRASIPNTSVTIPRLGFGTYSIFGPDSQVAALEALRSGYRHIDSAQLYKNEAHVQAALSQSSVARGEVFLTTKIGFAHNDPAKTYQKALSSIDALGGKGGYVDLLLIHTPGSSKAGRQELWEAFEKLRAEGRAKAIGVSNFRIRHLEEMKEYATVWPPHVNQIELHPWCQQRQLVEYCRANNILVEAYSPLSTGSRLGDPQLVTIAARHDKQPAQVLIRWSLQKGWVPLPKSVTPARIKANAEVYDFALGEDDMRALDALDMGAKGAEFPANVS